MVQNTVRAAYKRQIVEEMNSRQGQFWGLIMCVKVDVRLDGKKARSCANLLNTKGKWWKNASQSPPSFGATCICQVGVWLRTVGVSAIRADFVSGFRVLQFKFVDEFIVCKCGCKGRKRGCIAFKAASRRY